MSSKITTRPLEIADLPAVGLLHAVVMGPGRYARTAYRLREKTAPRQGNISPFCRAAFLGTRMIASLTLTEVTIGGRPGALLLGPLVVDPEFAGQGYGRRLVAESMEAARAAGRRLIVLVGDEAYYARLGFKHVPPGHIVFPGPVDPARILVAEMESDALEEFRGAIAPPL